MKNSDLSLNEEIKKHWALIRVDLRPETWKNQILILADSF